MLTTDGRHAGGAVATWGPLHAFAWDLGAQSSILAVASCALLMAALHGSLVAAKALAGMASVSEPGWLRYMTLILRSATNCLAAKR
eukprot:5230967-Pleurochrysis_carterae.AAC.1